MQQILIWIETAGEAVVVVRQCHPPIVLRLTAWRTPASNKIPGASAMACDQAGVRESSPSRPNPGRLHGQPLVSSL
jgi:hypothetical protein